MPATGYQGANGRQDEEAQSDVVHAQLEEPRGFGYLAAGVFGWLVAFLAIAATVFAFSCLISGHWPILCAGLWGRGSAEPPPGPLDLTAVTFFGLPGATLAVGLWWVLGATTAGARILRLAGLIPLVLMAGLAGWLSVGLSLCT